MTIALISHNDCILHDMGSGHPECPERIGAINKVLTCGELASHISQYDAPLVSKQALYATHDKNYVDSIFASSPTEGMTQLDPDTAMNQYTLQAAQRAAGAVIHAVDLVMEDKHKVAFCNVRPPGHHAEYDRAMGFCFFNNIAVGARYALDKWNLERVAIIDFDVHHGNGTEDIFRNESRVTLCSTFQSPLYPYKGDQTVSDHIINIPLSSGCDGDGYRRVAEKAMLPKLDAFQPELVFFSAGFDAHKADPLAGLNLLEEDYAWITLKVKEIADQYAQGRIVSSLEGGYRLEALARSVEAHLNALK